MGVEANRAHPVKWVQQAATAFPVDPTQAKMAHLVFPVLRVFLVSVVLRDHKAHLELQEIKSSAMTALLAIAVTMVSLVKWAPRVMQVKPDSTDSAANRDDVVLLVRPVCPAHLVIRV